MKYLKHIHPFLFTIFPALYLFSNNIQELFFSAWDFLPMVIGTLIIMTTMLFLVSFFVFKRDVYKAAILTTVSLIVFYSYGYAYDYLQSVFSSDIIRHRFLLPIVLLLLSAAYVFVFFSKKSFKEINAALNVAGTILIVMALVPIVHFLSLGIGEKAIQPYSSVSSEAVTEVIANETSRPDIYYIVLDGYADSDVLNLYYDFDNSYFLNFLIDNDFYIAYDSVSNYGYTYASMASALNMQYLDEIAAHNEIENLSISTLSYFIENNAVVDTLQKLDYQYVHLSSGYPMTNFNHHADVSYREGMDRFSLFLLNGTLLRPFVDPTSSYRIGFSRNDEVRKRLNFQFDTLKQLGATEGNQQPRFIFAHIVAPHQPFVFDAKGNPVDDRKDDSLLGYREQLEYVNSQIISTIETIKENTQTQPIIIIQSDHGANPPGTVEKIHKFHNFTAIDMGGYDTNQLLIGISPVNIFRAVFNSVFGFDLPLLERRVFISGESQVEFIEVTSEVLEQQTEVLDKL